MVEKQLRPAQDFIGNALRRPQHQSREAGSCMGAERPLGSFRAVTAFPPRQPTRSATTIVCFGAFPREGWATGMGACHPSHILDCSGRSRLGILE